MTAGTIIVPDKAKLNQVNATCVLDAAKTFKLTYHTSTWVPNDSTNEVFADCTNELPTGNGYTAGGITLTGVTLTQTAGVVKLTSNAAVHTAAGGSIPAWRHAVLRAVGTFNGKIDPIVGRFLGDGTNIDVPATTVGNNLTFTPNAAGIVTLT